MNELQQWMTQVQTISTSGEAQKAGADLPEIKYAKPGRQPDMFEQMRKPENQPKQMPQPEIPVSQAKEEEQKQPVRTPATEPEVETDEKSPLERQMELMLAQVQQQEKERRQRQREQARQQEAQQQQSQQASSEQVDDLVRRVEILENTSDQTLEQIGRVADVVGNVEGRVENIEANYVGQQTFQDSIEAFEGKLAQVLKPTVIQVPGRAEVKFEQRVHCAFADTLLMAQVFQQAYLVGPAGSGKTSLCEAVAQALSLDFGFISCSAGMAEAHLLGRMIATGEYLVSRFAHLYENGGVFLFDEVDAADANTMLVLNSALANGYLSVPNRQGNPVARRHADFVCLVAANTLGTGSFEYHGRNYLDAAFLDRFALSRLQVDYDLDLERELLAGDAEMGRLLHKMRFNLESSKTRRLVSTRAFVSASKLLLAGQTPQQVVDRLTLGWSPEEKARALKDVVVPKKSPLTEAGDKQRAADQKKREKELAAEKVRQAKAQGKTLLPGKNGEPVEQATEELVSDTVVVEAGPAEEPVTV